MADFEFAFAVPEELPSVRESIGSTSPSSPHVPCRHRPWGDFLRIVEEVDY
jgi:hypothetical protein